MKYVFMAAHVTEFKITTMSRALEASRSGFYAWRSRLNRSSAQAQRRDHLDEVVKAAFVAGKGRSGSPRLTLDLADAGEVFDRKTVANSQRRQGLRAKAAKKCWRRFKTEPARRLKTEPGVEAARERGGCG